MSNNWLLHVQEMLNPEYLLLDKIKSLFESKESFNDGVCGCLEYHDEFIPPRISDLSEIILSLVFSIRSD